MKTWFIVLFLEFLPLVIYSQNLTLEERQQYIADLDSADESKRLNALDNIIEYQIIEALPKIENIFWKEEYVSNQLMALKAIYRLNSTNLHSFAKAFFDSSESIAKKPYTMYTSLELKVEATYYLHQTGDYSTTIYIFDLLRCSESRKNAAAQNTLKSIIQHVPEYADSAKEELIHLKKEAPFWFSRIRALDDLAELYGEEMFPEIVDMVVNDNDAESSNRFSALRLLYKMNYPGLHNLLKDRLSKEIAPAYRGDIADSLLIRYGGVQDYVLVNNYLNQEVNPTIKSLLGFSIRDFIPPRSDLSIPLNQLIDSLESCQSQVRFYNWIGEQSFVTELNNYLVSAKNNLTAGNQVDCARQIRTFQQTVDKEYRDSTNATPAFVTIEGWKFLYYKAQYILDRLPQIPPSGCNVKLISSTGTKLTSGTLQYYDGAWKDAVNNNNGTFFINTTKTSLSLRMTYEYGTQTKSNVTVGFDTVAFQTVNAQIQLQNSSGVLIDTGTVQYYAGAWRNLGTTTNGIAAKELLPANYSFRMTYAYASKDKQQDIGTNATVVFQTVNAAVQLKNSLGSLIDQGTVQYYSGAWRDFGTTTNGVATKELLPNNYSFRMSYAYASKDKQQDLSTNPTVVFQTVNAAIQLKNSLGTLIDQGTVQYYSGAWRELGITTGGVANKELLPNNYSFRMTYAYASKDKQQDLGTNPTVVFQTVNAVVQLKNSLGNLIPAHLGDQGTVQYYSGTWRTLGTTTSGIASKELLPNNYSFRMMYEYVSVDKAQDISTNNTISFSTVLCTVRVKNSQNQPVNGAMMSYYSGAWRQIGNTVNGEATKELFPVNLSFRVKYGTQQQDKQQNLSTNNVVEFGIQ